MTFLAKEQNKEEYLEQMTQLSKSAKVQTKYVLKAFDVFCKKEFEKTEEEVIQELRMLKKTKTEDEYKESLYKMVSQPFINELSLVYNASYVKTMFSYFKRYLVWHGIVIYREESRIHLRFPKKNKDEKHILKKEEVRQICNIASPKRRMLYLVLSSSTMRITETVMLRKKDFDVKDGKVTIHIKAPYTKTKEARHTFCSQEATELLIPHLETLQNYDLVFGVNEDPMKSKSVEEVTFARYRQKAGFCNCDVVGNDKCAGKYTSSNIHKISLHSFRSYSIKTINRIDFGLGNSLAGHGYYMKNYDSMDIEEKRALYQQAEPNLSIFTSTKEMDNLSQTNLVLQDEIQRLKLRMEKMEATP
jgi:integrase